MYISYALRIIIDCFVFQYKKSKKVKLPHRSQAICLQLHNKECADLLPQSLPSVVQLHLGIADYPLVVHILPMIFKDLDISNS